MRLGQLAAYAVLWQSTLVLNLPTQARPEHLRYQRTVEVLSGGSGMACAVLDQTVFAHTASAAHIDLRLFGRLPGGTEAEVPYTLTESGPEPVADTLAAVEHPGVSSNVLSFDLRMPARAYSEVRLHLGLRNFVGTATVEGRDRQGSHKDLGSVPVFDLSSQHLGRLTSLLLGESSFPVLHIALALRTPQGAPMLDVSPAVLQGAEVPPSRLRQTRYVPTVSTRQIDQRGFLSVAMLRVPAHVPVERVSFAYGPGFNENFSREVTVSARADREPITNTEALDAGAIAHVSFPSGDPRLYPIDYKEDALDATMGATLAKPATVLVAVNNDGQQPLPIRTITLEMRERKVCFFADRQGSYTLRYGDPALHAPVYDESALGVPAEVLEARLGPETVNPGFRPRPEGRSYLRRHPELFWVFLLFSAGLMGGTALQYVQHRRV